MARKKTTEEQEVTAENLNMEGVEEQVETTEAPAAESEKEEIEVSSQKVEVDAGDVAQSKEIPADVQKVLKCFPKEEELYVNRFGGVFTKDTEPSAVAGAILYKNPYYEP